MAIACLNINSLIARIDELRIFISDAKIDILCVNETKLDPSINDREVYLAGYEIVRRDRNVNGRNGGGGGGCAFILLSFQLKCSSNIDSIHYL